MKPIRTIAYLLAAAFLLGLCCTGCAKKPEAPVSTPEPTAECTPEASETPAPEGYLIRWQDGGTASFLSHEPIAIPALSETVYTRPDTQALADKFDALIAKVPGCDDPEALLNDYFDIVLGIRNFNTMYCLALYRYSLDISDDHYAEEYDFCDEESAIVEEKENSLYAAFAASPCCEALEAEYFGEGFFLDYDHFNAGGETYFDLKQQENDLLFDYYELSGEADLSLGSQVEKYHEPIGELFIELVKVRGRIASAKGYENYADYSYACDFKRDYTPEQAREYLDTVKERIAPILLSPKVNKGFYSNWSNSRSMDMLSSAAEKIGGPVWDSFRFMYENGLYDVSNSRKKMDIGYTAYLDDYESPFIFIDPDAYDLLCTLFHEFGHFTDFYCNYGAALNVETGETYSQAMPYLAFAYAEPFTDREREQNLRAVLADLLYYGILREAAYADFELQVYSLSEEELTLDKLDEIYKQCMTDYGLVDPEKADSVKQKWISCHHFFDFPGYVIGYSVSAVASLQICRLEAEEAGAGAEAFCRLLERTRGKKFSAILEEAALDSPFSEDTIIKTEGFLKEAFGIE